MIYDLTIIGGGPAGCAGAVYAARKQLKTLMILEEFGGQSNVSEDIQNWIGTPSLSGRDLAENLKKHASGYVGEFLEIKEGERASKIEASGSTFTVETNSGGKFETKTILIASGSSRRKLEVPGAKEFENKGITYCASCDGPIFADQDVAVIGGGNAGFETAAQLLAYCKSVTLLHRSADFKADKITVEKVLANPRMHGLLNIELKEIYGGKFVEGLKYINKKNEEVKDLKVTGIFAEIGQIPNTDFVGNLVEKDQYDRIKIDPWTQQASVPGIWAAGDCSTVLYHQNNIAAGDAVRAVENIYLWLHTK